MKPLAEASYKSSAGKQVRIEEIPEASKANPGQISLSPFQYQASKYLTNSYPVCYNKDKRE